MFLPFTFALAIEKALLGGVTTVGVTLGLLPPPSVLGGGDFTFFFRAPPAPAVLSQPIAATPFRAI